MIIPACDIWVHNATLQFPDTDLSKHHVIGILGSTGSGKTSLLEFLYNQTSLVGMTVRYMKQNVIMHPSLTVMETLEFYQIMRGRWDAQSIRDILTAMKMNHLQDRPIGSLADGVISGGEKKMVMFASVLLDDVDLILLDEPFSGVDTAGIEIMMSLLTQKKQRACIMLTGHQLSDSVRSRFDEEWTLEQDHNVIRVRRTLWDNDPEWQCIALTDARGRPDARGRHRWWHLLRREYLIRRRDPMETFIKFFMPTATIAFQSFFIGFLSTLKDEWIRTGDAIIFFKMLLNYNIVLFTAGIIPISFLNDHYRQKLVVECEVSQGLYPFHVYIWTMIWIDHIILIASSAVIAAMAMPTWAFLGNLLCVMLFTNVAMWVLSYTVMLPLAIVLMMLTIYLSMSYIMNFGFMLVYQNTFVAVLQYLSMIHVQTNIFLHTLPDVPLVQASYQRLNMMESPPLLWSLLSAGYLLLGYLCLLIRHVRLWV